MVNPGGLEPPAAGLKVPCPADPGFTLGGHDPAFVRRHFVCSLFGARGRDRPSFQTVIGRRRRFSGSRANGGTPSRIRTPECRCVKPMPSAAWRTERSVWCARGDLNATERDLKPLPLPLGYSRVPAAGIEPALSGV